MKKSNLKKTYKYKSYYLLAVLLISAILLFALLPRKQPIDKKPQATQTQPTPSIKTYHSESLGITFDYPIEFEVEERFGIVRLKKDSEHEIVLLRNGTEAPSLDKYLEESDNLPEQRRIVERTEININGLDGIKFNTKYQDFQYKNYFGYLFYNNYAVYSIYSYYYNLRSDLDQIAQSFRYDP